VACTPTPATSHSSHQFNRVQVRREATLRYQSTTVKQLHPHNTHLAFHAHCCGMHSRPRTVQPTDKHRLTISTAAPSILLASKPDCIAFASSYQSRLRSSCTPECSSDTCCTACALPPPPPLPLLLKLLPPTQQHRHAKAYSQCYRHHLPAAHTLPQECPGTSVLQQHRLPNKQPYRTAASARMHSRHADKSRYQVSSSQAMPAKHARQPTKLQHRSNHSHEQRGCSLMIVQQFCA
jgi:hypothetical protein